MCGDVSTLVVCLTRGDLGTDPPVVGRSAAEALVTGLGVEDPEDSRVNCILEGLRVSRDLDEETVLAVLARSEQVGGERAFARQLDDLVADHDPDSAVVVVDSAEDERFLPVVESRLPVAAVDRVVVRQARDIESTYYLLKQFLADEQLRRTVLVPVGLALLAFPALLAVSESFTVALGAIAAVFGLLVLSKGLRIGALLADLSAELQEALYRGRVSVVTYVVASGLALVGGTLGVLEASSLDAEGAVEPLVLVQFVHAAIPWFATAVLIASAGRLLDGLLREAELGTYVNLPFVAVAVGLAVRGFTAYFLQVSDASGPFEVPTVTVGVWEMEGFVITPGTYLTGFILASIVVSLVGVRVASYVSSPADGSLDGRV
ncbi:MAG: putative membrane protein [Halovenus sp.]